MGFDFRDAISGSQIYLNGQPVNPQYEPSSKKWHLNYGGPLTFDQYGISQDNYYDLSTDVPKKKNKKVVWINVNNTMDDNGSYPTSNGFTDKNLMASGSDSYSTYKLEIETDD